VTNVGRLHSDQARLTHGLTATRVLPGEDPEEAIQEALRWHDDVKPQGARQHHLLDALLTAARQVRRCDRYLTATVAGQIQSALTNLRQKMEAEVARNIALFPKDPYEAIAALRGSSLGCQWLIKQWELLRQALLDFGFFTSHHLWLMIRLSGAAPVLKLKKVDAAEFITLNVEKFHIEFHALFCRPTPPEPSEIRKVFQMPSAGMEAAYQAKWPNREAHQAELLRRIDAALAELRAREEELRTGPEAVQQALAADQALMIADPVMGRLCGRYASDGHSVFFRSCRELRLLRQEAAEDEEAEVDADAEADEEVAEETVASEGPKAAEESAPAATEESPKADFPDDPKVQDSESQDPDAPSTCDTDSGLHSETRYRALKAALAKLDAAGLAEPCARGAPG
jgi:hypothetical protein